MGIILTFHGQKIVPLLIEVWQKKNMNLHVHEQNSISSLDRIRPETLSIFYVETVYQVNIHQKSKSIIHIMQALRWARLSRKVPYVLSRCHTIRRMSACGRVHPSFGMKPTF